MKKFFSLVLALVMALSLTTVAFGDAVTEVSVTDTATANAALAAAVTNTVITLEEGDYGELKMVNTADARSNITIVGEGTVTVELLALGTSSSFSNITIKNIIFDGDAYGVEVGSANCHPGIHVATTVNGMDVIGCTFEKSANIGVGGSYSISDLYVYDCVFDQEERSISTNYSPIYISGTSNGVTVEECDFYDCCANAIQVNGTVNGDVTIVGNKIDGTADRALRFGSVQDDVVVTIANTTFVGTDYVDDDGEVMKVTSIADGATVSADVPAGATVNVGDAVFFDGAFSGLTLNAAGEITGGTFSDDVSAYLADDLSLTQTTAGTYVTGTTVTFGDKFDLYLADDGMNAALKLKTPDVAGLSFTEVAAKTNKDGSGNVAYIAANNGQYFVKTSAPTVVDYAVTDAGKNTVLYYVTVAGTSAANFEYSEAVSAFTKFSTYAKCDYVTATPVAGEDYFMAADGNVYMAAAAGTGTNYLLNGKVVSGIYAGVPETHTFTLNGYKYDATLKQNVPVSALCTKCMMNTGSIYPIAKVPATYTLYPTTGEGSNFYTVALPGASAVVTPSTPAGDKVQSAETFDAGIAMYVGMSVMAATGSAVVIGKKRG